MGLSAREYQVEIEGHPGSQCILPAASVRYLEGLVLGGILALGYDSTRLNIRAVHPSRGRGSATYPFAMHLLTDYFHRQLRYGKVSIMAVHVAISPAHGHSRGS